MPIDEHGNRADLWIDMTSPVARNNPGQLYEQGINFISTFVQKAIAKTLEDSGVDKAFDVLTDWYEDINPNYAALARGEFTSTHMKKGLVKDAIEAGPRLNIPPFLNTLRPAEGDFWNALRNMMKWQKKWNAYPTKIRWKSLQPDGTGKEFVSEVPFVIGSKYVLNLHKIPEIFSCGPASVNHIGIPTKSGDHNSKHFPVSQNPYRFGEDEHRVMSMGADTRWVVRFRDLNSNSPTGVRVAIESILSTDTPTAISYIPISNGDLARTSAVNNLFHNTASILGVETKNTKIDHLDVPDELSEAIWQTAKEEDDEKPASKRNTNKKPKIGKFLQELENSDGFMGDDENPEFITEDNDPLAQEQALEEEELEDTD